VPYTVVLISLDDAPEIRVVGNMVDIGHDQVRIGMAVSAVWEERTVEDETIQLLFWTAV